MKFAFLGFGGMDIQTCSGKRGQMKRPLCLFCLLLSALFVFCMKVLPAPVPDYENLDGRQLILEGQVYRKEYKGRANSGKTLAIYVKPLQILSGFEEESRDSQYSIGNLSENNPIDEIENIICYLDEENILEPKLGNVVRLEGKVRIFADAGNPGEFDMGKYYRMMKLSFRLDNARITAAGTKAWHFREGLFELKEHWAKVLEDVFPAKEASIMKAMLLGEKDGIDEDTKKLYQQNSIIHILAISGLHISMIGMGLYHLLRKAGLGIGPGAVISVFVICCYGLMTGMSMSAVRAIVMFGLHLFADMMGRAYDMITALSLAAVLLLAQQPAYAEHSGFLFSFGAVASIGVLLPVLQGDMERGSGRKRLAVRETLIRKARQALKAGIAVNLGTLPVHLMTYYQFPLYSILLNLAVIPLMTVVMGAGLLCMLTGTVFPGVARGIGAIDRGILWFYEWCCLLNGKIPGGVLVSGRPENWQILVYLLLMAMLAAYGHRAKKRLSAFWKYQWILAALCILFLKAENGFQVTMLDVGQGDCIHIRSGEGKNYLIDGGSSTKKEVMEYQILPYLKYKGINCLEAVFVTHSDGDHCSGILDLLEGYADAGLKVERIILPHIGRESVDEKYREIEELARQQEIEVLYMHQGQRIADGEMEIVCMHPDSGYETREANEYSLVLLVAYQGFTGLFTGDVEGAGEESMWGYMQEYMQKYAGESGVDDCNVTLLKVAHHGSNYSTGEEMLNRLRPRIALISCGKDNRYGHPHEELLERLERAGSRIYDTPGYGAVTVEKKEPKIWQKIRTKIGTKIRIETFRVEGK